MNWILTALAFLFIFSVLVLIHEWGHFYAAKKAGIKVEEFGFGLPPRIWGKKRGEVLYSINAIPFGGFVKLLGEDSSDPKVKNDKRSFISKPPRVRILVVTAGVIMNFLLAFVLLTIGFIVGMQPLITNSDDLFAQLKSGNIQTMTGVVVKSVDDASKAQSSGLMKDDVIVSLNGQDARREDVEKFLRGEAGGKYEVKVLRNGSQNDLQIATEKGKSLGVVLYDHLPLPRLIIQNVKSGSPAESSGLRVGDIILSAANESVYSADDFQKYLGASEVPLMVSRGYKIENILLKQVEVPSVIVTQIYPNTPAEQAGLKVGDMLERVNGKFVQSPERAIAEIQKNVRGDIQLAFARKNAEGVAEQQRVVLKTDDKGLIGVGLSVLQGVESQDITYYQTTVESSLLSIKDIRYPFWLAPVKAFDESVKLSGLTIQMFFNVIKNVVTQFSVPEGVAGPVGIFQLTYVFVQEGLVSLMRFMALLSLSLAIINVLPFPALDGGRLFFILAEVIVGRRLGAKFESIIHAVGFVILMLIIFAVTYNDILRLF